MDNINVSSDALVSAAQILKRLDAETSEIYQRCSSAIAGKLGEVDDSFRKDLERFLDEIKELHNAVKVCNEENVEAISDRFSRLSEYENHVYVQRNLG